MHIAHKIYLWELRRVSKNFPSLRGRDEIWYNHYFPRQQTYLSIVPTGHHFGWLECPYSHISKIWAMGIPSRRDGEILHPACGGIQNDSNVPMSFWSEAPAKRRISGALMSRQCLIEKLIPQDRQHSFWPSKRARSARTRVARSAAPGERDSDKLFSPERA